jgi:hypothetical protein
VALRQKRQKQKLRRRQQKQNSDADKKKIKRIAERSTRRRVALKKQKKNQTRDCRDKIFSGQRRCLFTMESY